MKPRYSTVQHEVRLKLDLSLVEYCLLDSIDKLSNRPEFPWCEVSRPRLGAFLGVSETTVKDAIKRFIENGYLEVDLKTRCVRTTIKWHNEVNVKGSISDPGVGQFPTPPGSNSDPLYIYKDSNKDIEVSQEVPSFEEYLETRPEVTSDYEGDGEVSELVYRLNGKVVSVKTLLKDYEKAFPTPPVRPLNAPRTRDSFDFDTWLVSLSNSSKKEDKIVALIWKEKGYRFANYQQWRSQMDMDGVYARKLTGYTGDQIFEAIERCRRDGEKGGYDWKASTVVKKIAEITI